MKRLPEVVIAVGLLILVPSVATGGYAALFSSSSIPPTIPLPSTISGSSIDVFPPCNGQSGAGCSQALSWSATLLTPAQAAVYWSQALPPSYGPFVPCSGVSSVAVWLLNNQASLPPVSLTNPPAGGSLLAFNWLALYDNPTGYTIAVPPQLSSYGASPTYVTGEYIAEAYVTGSSWGLYAIYGPADGCGQSVTITTSSVGTITATTGGGGYTISTTVSTTSATTATLPTRTSTTYTLISTSSTSTITVTTGPGGSQSQSGVGLSTPGFFGGIFLVGLGIVLKWRRR